MIHEDYPSPKAKVSFANAIAVDPWGNVPAPQWANMIAAEPPPPMIFGEAAQPAVAPAPAQPVIG